MVRGDLVAAGGCGVAFREAIVIQKKVFGEEHPDVADSLFNLRRVLADEHRVAEAEAACREALAMRRKLMGNEHPQVAVSLYSLATLCRTEGKLAEARSLAEEALAMYRRHPDWPQNEREHAFEVFGNVLTDLAMGLLMQGKVDEAESVSRDLLALSGQLPKPWQASALNRIAWLLATALGPKLRGGTNAISFAEKAVALTSRTNARHLDTLAAAYAASG